MEVVCSGNCPDYSLISQEFLQTMTTCYLFKKPAVSILQKKGKQTKKANKIAAETKIILLAEMVRFSISPLSATGVLMFMEKIHYKNPAR